MEQHDITRISSFLQAELHRRGLDSVTAVEAARWLDEAGILADSRHRHGLPLRDILRADKSRIAGARQEPPRKKGSRMKGWWFIDPVGRP